MDTYRKNVKSFIRRQEKLSDGVSSLFERGARGIVAMLGGREGLVSSHPAKLRPLRCYGALFTLVGIRSSAGALRDGTGVYVEAVMDDNPLNEKLAPVIGRSVGQKCMFSLDPQNFSSDDLRSVVLCVYCQTSNEGA